MMKNGYLPSRLDRRDFMVPLADAATIAALPDELDLSPADPLRLDQNGFGACVWNSLIKLHHFVQIQEGLVPVVGSRLMGYLESRRASASGDATIPYDLGTTPRDALKVLAKIGVCPESEWPYDWPHFAAIPPQQCYDDAKQYAAIVYRSIYTGGSLQETKDQIKACLAAGHPIIFGFTDTQGYRNTGPDGMIGPYTLPVYGGHANIGWGYSTKLDRLRVENWWGDSWGDHGFGWMPWDYLDGSADVWTLSLVGALGKSPLAVELEHAATVEQQNITALEAAITTLEGR